MSIENRIRIIRRVDLLVQELLHQYPSHTAAHPELARVHHSLHQLTEYLSSLDQLKPNYTTNEIEKPVEAINLNLDILKGELKKPDYVKLSRGFKLIKTLLKFHPARYSFFEFVFIWIYELIYFI